MHIKFGNFVPILNYTIDRGSSEVFLRKEEHVLECHWGGLEEEAWRHHLTQVQLLLLLSQKSLLLHVVLLFVAALFNLFLEVYHLQVLVSLGSVALKEVLRDDLFL